MSICYGLRKWRGCGGEINLKNLSARLDFDGYQDASYGWAGGYAPDSFLFKEVPIVALTAFAFEVRQRQGYRAGCNDFLTKPVSQNALEKVLDKYVK